jgi:hypothetical protein
VLDIGKDGGNLERHTVSCAVEFSDRDGRKALAAGRGWIDPDWSAEELLFHVFSGDGGVRLEATAAQDAVGAIPKVT